MKKYIYSLLAVSVLTLVLASCLKDENVENGVYGMNGTDADRIIELPSPPGSPHSLIINLVFSTADTTFALVTVNLAGDQPASEDIQVTLVKDPSLIADYNTVNGTNYTEPPANLYSMEPLTVTIPRGSRFGYLRITTKPSNMATAPYAFGFKIGSVSNTSYKISGNFDKIVVIVGVKNRYDGIYLMKFKMLDWTAFAIHPGIWNWGGPVHMITSGTNSVKLFDDWGFGTYIHPAVNTTPAYTGFGSTEPKFFFDLTTNAMINVTNDFPNPSNGRQFTMNPAITTSRWDPGTGNIYAAILLNQPGRPTLQIFDTLTYVGPR